MASRVFAGDLEAHEEMFQELDGAARRRMASALRELLDVFEAPGRSRIRERKIAILCHFSQTWLGVTS